ncbi:hypothetical protein BJ944DRAFT_244587 [Cunninghamella echinulata]|nr:hypothetical protein BJ944DRAFT_244587 [Cunninghamella echinulata]
MKIVLLLLLAVFAVSSVAGAEVDDACYKKCMDEFCADIPEEAAYSCGTIEGPSECTPKCRISCDNERYATSIGQPCKCNTDCVGGGKSSCQNSICCRDKGSYTNNLNECCSKKGVHVPISSDANYRCS